MGPDSGHCREHRQSPDWLRLQFGFAGLDAQKRRHDATGFTGMALHQLATRQTAPKKTVGPEHIPLDFTAKASIAVGVGLVSWSPPCLAPTAGLVVVQASRQARCKMESEAWRLGEPASKRRRRHQQRSILGSSISKSFRNSERDAERRNPRARSRSAAARIGQAGATAGAADGAAVHDKPEQTRSRSEPTSGHIDLGAGSVSGAEQPPASTKRAKLIAMLERREGASVAEIGQRLGWLPHTVRAAITGLRKAGRAVTRNKEADDRSVYRLAPVDPASQR